MPKPSFYNTICTNLRDLTEDLFVFNQFYESLNSPPYVDLQAPEVIAPIPEAVAPEYAVSTGSPSSTTLDQDAPSQSNSHTTQETQTPIISHDVEEDNHDIEVAHMGNDPYFGILIPEVTSDQSSSSDVIHTIVPPDHQVSEHNIKWTKDHPLENIIGALDRPFSHRLQLHEQALFCYYDAFLTSVEPKNYKDALTQACWIEAMQEELHEFERLEVWELVPPLRTAFLNGRSAEEFYVSQPDRFVDPGKPNHVYKLKKALYGLKQAPRSLDTPMVETSKLDGDKEGKAIDPSHYCGMIGTLLYLTGQESNLQFAILMARIRLGLPEEANAHNLAVTTLGDRLVSLVVKKVEKAAISSMES
ncbi:retrovirus-related pol polyprotein from transposon TNT 1-94 [Tanacetum coccineum]